MHLADPALAAAALGAGPELLHADLRTTGLLFESAVFHDVAVLTSALGAEVRHFRDSNGREIDLVVTLPDGRWGAIEVKLGGSQAAAGTRSLGAAIADIDTTTAGEPTFRVVVTGTGPAYITDDGTVIAPLHTLRP
jgi:predicted AAA+ superfamily ATPase